MSTIPFHHCPYVTWRGLPTTAIRGGAECGPACAADRDANFDALRAEFLEARAAEMRDLWRAGRHGEANRLGLRTLLADFGVIVKPGEETTFACEPWWRREGER